MQAFIRISPEISATANDWAKTKSEMISICHASFLGVGGYTLEKHYILDNCPDMWADYFSVYGKVTRTSIGVKRDTVAKMFEIAREEAKDDVLLFLEDDYLWRNDAKMSLLESATKNFGVVIPYDHPDHYKGVEHHWMKIFDNKVYRMCRTATHTFAVTKDIFLKQFDTFNHGRHDWEMWTKQNIEGVFPWSPVYGFATHLAKDLIALDYDYKELYDGYRENIKVMEGSV